MTWDKYMDYVHRNFRYIINGDKRTGSVPYKWDEDGYPIKFVRVTRKVYEDEIKKSVKYHCAEGIRRVWPQIPPEKKGELK